MHPQVFDQVQALPDAFERLGLGEDLVAGGGVSGLVDHGAEHGGAVLGVVVGVQGAGDASTSSFPSATKRYHLQVLCASSSAVAALSTKR